MIVIKLLTVQNQQMRSDSLRVFFSKVTNSKQPLCHNDVIVQQLCANLLITLYDYTAKFGLWISSQPLCSTRDQFQIMSSMVMVKFMLLVVEETRGLRNGPKLPRHHLHLHISAAVICQDMGRGPLRVYCGTWHQDSGSGSLGSCMLWRWKLG